MSGRSSRQHPSVAAVRHGGCFHARKRRPHKAAGRRRPLPRSTFRQTLAPASTLPESCSSACCAKLLHCTSGLNQNVTEGRKTAPTEVRPLCNTRPGNEPPTKPVAVQTVRSEEHTSELQSLMRISYAVFCLKKKKR